MALRFWRRIGLLPGLDLNLSKSGASFSLGPRGAKYTLGTGGRRATVGIPGTGLFYSVRTDRGRRGGRRHPEMPRPDARHRLNPGFFRRLVMPAADEALVDGFRALVEGDEDRALGKLEAAGKTHIDARWLAGMLRLKRGHHVDAEAHLRAVLARAGELGASFAQYGVTPTASIAVTPEITAHVQPGRRGVLLALTELYQAREELHRARECLAELLDDSPDDVVARLSMAELLLAETGETEAAADRIVRLAEGIENESDIHATLLLYRGRALRRLGLHDAAFRTLTVAWRRKKGRDPELLRRIRYERALAYEAAGRASRARSEFEAIYAESPGYEDVAARLGVG